MRRSKLKTFIVLAASALWLGVLGWIDHATGYELGLFAFYTAPVGVAAWHLGQVPGFGVALLASVIWYLADQSAGDRYSVSFYGYWNTGMHFTTFIINAFTFAKIRTSLDQRHALERELAETREQLRQATAERDLRSMAFRPDDKSLSNLTAQDAPDTDRLPHR